MAMLLGVMMALALAAIAREPEAQRWAGDSCLRAGKAALCGSRWLCAFCHARAARLVAMRLALAEAKSEERVMRRQIVAQLEAM